MWDKVLNVIDEATTLKRAVLGWGGEPDSVELVSRGVNLVYRFKRGQKRCYLRITHSQLRPLEELKAALGFQQYLSDHHVPVCRLMLSEKGNAIEPIHQGEHVFLAHVCAQVPGEVMSFNHGNASLYEHWGQALGQFHAVSTQYQPHGLEYGQWEDDMIELPEYAQHEDNVIQTELETIIGYLQSHPRTSQNYALIHGDHRKGNVLTDGEYVHFIDFDLPRYCWLMDDISRPFFSSIMQHHSNWQDKLPLYIKGYRLAFSLTQDELQTFSWFIRYKALHMYLWTKNNWHGDIAPGGASTQQWLKLLRAMVVEQSWVPSLDAVIASPDIAPKLVPNLIG